MRENDDGTSISVWNNYWMKNDVTIFPMDDVATTLANLRVSDCIMPNQKSWNIPMLNSIFTEQIVEYIVSTPLYPSVREDRLIWKKESNGDYSVRSAYRMCMNELLDTSHFKVEGAWDLIWKLKVPPRIKSLLWRICRNCLPTCTRLRGKGVNCAAVCALCNVDEEDSVHLIFKCPSSKNIWSMWNPFYSVNHLFDQYQDVKDIIFRILQVLSNDDASLFGCIIWSIWKQRNNKIWKEVTDAQGYVFDRAKTLLEDWKSAKSIQKVSVGSEQQACITKWMKPSSGRFKCNIDAAFSETANLVGIGMCIRDEEGHFVLAKMDYFSPTCEVHIGEALGLLSAMDWVHLLQLGTVDFEMDAKRVVDSFNSRQSEATEYGNIIDNCKTLSRQFYENSRVEFVRRQANEVAHSLAKAALSSASSQILVEIPNCIEHILFNEMQ